MCDVTLKQLGATYECFNYYNVHTLYSIGVHVLKRIWGKAILQLFLNVVYSKLEAVGRKPSVKAGVLGSVSASLQLDGRCIAPVKNSSQP